MSGEWSWIGVDLDGTLAANGPSPTYDGSIGEPVPAMVARVKQWLSEGREVRILTARVAGVPVWGDARDAEPQRAAIMQWCLDHIGAVLPVTAEKDYGMRELWDDRAITVARNAGHPSHALGPAHLAHIWADVFQAVETMRALDEGGVNDLRVMLDILHQSWTGRDSV